MALNKSVSKTALTAHVFMYTLTLAVGISMLTLVTGEMIFAFSVINFICHWITDSLTSQGTKYFREKNDTHNFFVVIGFDQLIHQITLMITAITILGVK